MKNREIGLAAGVALAALAARAPFLSHESGDFRYYLSVWYDLIVANGYAASWQYGFSNYNPPYLYLLTAVAYFAPFAPKLLAVKAVSIAGDFLLGLFAYRCVRLRYPDSRNIPILAAGAVLLLPTVVANSARLGQLDALYTAFLLASLHGLLSGRKAWGLAAFGLALSVKLQAVFFAPLLYWLWAKKEIAGRYFALVPAVFLLLLLPAALAGRPPLELLTIYLDQAGRYSRFSISGPNFYRFIPDDHYYLWPLGVLLTAALVHGVRRLLEKSRFEMTRETVVFLALFSVLILPFFLPKMHGRYFFPAGVFAVVLAFYRPRLWQVPVSVGLASLAVYRLILPDSHALLLDGAVALLAFVVADLARRLFAAAGWRPDFGAMASRWWNRLAAAAPLLLFSLAFAALFAVFAGDGRLARPLTNDGTSAQTLARAADRELGGPFVSRAERESVPFRADRFEAPPAPGNAAAFDRLLGVLLRHLDGDRRFGGDLTAQVVAARALMLALFGGAALLAYFSLCRVLAFRWPSRGNSNRWIALAATLFAFGSTAAAAADTVTAAGAPAVFGVFLLFHGMAVFLGEGRFGQLLVKTGAALLLGWGAALLLVPFVALGLVGERRRRAGEGESAGWLRPLPAMTVRGPFASPFLALGAFSLVFGAVSFGVAAVSAGSLGTAEPVIAQPSPGEALAEGFRRTGQGVLPFAAFGRVPSAEVAVVSVGALAAAAGLAGAALARSLPLLTLALSGLGAAFWFGGGGFPGAGALSALPLSLTGTALALSAARRAFGVWAAGVGIGLAAAGWAFSWVMFLSAAGGEGGGRPGPAAETREAGLRLREDFSRIRRALSRRYERTLFLAPLPAGNETLGGARAAFFLAGYRWATDPAQRAFAEMVVRPPAGSGRTDGEGAAAPGNLTPDNERAILYHRATHDGEIGRLLAANPPRVRDEFEVHLVTLPTGGEWLLFAKDECRRRDTDGIFIALLEPENQGDLGRRRRPYGFGNRSFYFADGAFGPGERCVAGARLPSFPIASVRVGRTRIPNRGRLNHPDDTYPVVWEARFEISENAASPPPPPPTGAVTSVRPRPANPNAARFVRRLPHCAVGGATAQRGRRPAGNYAGRSPANSRTRRFRPAVRKSTETFLPSGSTDSTRPTPNRGWRTVSPRR